MERPAEVLLMEDNLGDVYLARECFGNAARQINLHHAENGEQGLAFLRKEGRFAGVPTPDLILLDLNMPRMDGRQVMEALAADEELRHLPVVVLTTSSNEADVLHMHKLRCNSYIVKPLDLEPFQRIIEGICDYWFDTVELPRPS